ncbi:hypothetical protein HA402_007242 [Bradysia odoriphaga]|nr:hypothetical protein HA402_007242 [Bradysia odoriphaga]
MNFIKQIGIQNRTFIRKYHITSFNCCKSNPVNLAYNSYENVDDQNEGSNEGAVVIMHGLFGSKQNWKSICKALSQKSNPKRKIIALDARNHGESPHVQSHTYIDLAEDVRHFFEQNSITKSVCIGHSMGGRAMMCFALKYPELVDRAIIVDVSPVRSSPSLIGMGGIFAAMTTVNIPATMKMSEGRSLANEQLMDAIPSKETRDFVLMNLVKGADGRFSWRANVEALHQNFNDHISTFPESLAGKQYHGPVLFLAGSKSDYIKKGDLDGIKTIFPNSDLKFIDSGHLVHVERPYEFLDLVLKFINH